MLLPRDLSLATYEYIVHLYISHRFSVTLRISVLLDMLEKFVVDESSVTVRLVCTAIQVNCLYHCIKQQQLCRHQDNSEFTIHDASKENDVRETGF